MQNEQVQKNISSPADGLQNNYTDVITQLEQALRTDAQRVQYMLQQGVINSTQGQYLMAQLAKKSDEINKCKQSVPPHNVQAQPQTPPPTVEQNQVNSLDAFIQENPDFFNNGARGIVLEYLKNCDLDKDEISRVTEMVEQLENSAVENYLKQSAHEKSLNDENNAAKSKLTAYAQNSASGSDTGRIFTREDIGKMSGEEFTKNEKLIMDQVKHGLIK